MQKCEIYHDNFQNFKKYNIPKAQLVIADIPYNIGADAYGSNPNWYNGGDNKNGESKLAKKSFFNSDGYFKIAEYMHFCSRLLKPEPKEKGKAPAMIVFCAFQQMPTVVEYGKKYGFNNSFPLFFCKNYSAQALKANMRIFAEADIPKICVENPVGKMSSYFRKPDCIIQPYEFGHNARKKTCLWLKGLPALYPTNIVDAGEILPGGYSVGASADCAKDERGKILSWNDPRTAKIRSKTFPGIAKAMAEQWG